MSLPSTAATAWAAVLTLDNNRHCVAGSAEALADAVRRAADLRIYTEFRHNEHIEPGAKNDELIQEVAEFRETLLVDDEWVAGIMTLRQPVLIPGFGPRPSLSLFMYNQDGGQAIARLYLDGPPVTGTPGPAPLDDYRSMPKYHQLDNWDAGTNAPSHNFVYDFDVYRYCVRDDWREVLAHDAEGEVVAGSMEELVDAFSSGAEVKVGVRGLCDDLAPNASAALDHEIFIQVGACYHLTRQGVFTAGSHPLVRCAAAIPTKYTSRGWDYGWLIPRTDGLVMRWLVDPYRLQFVKSESRHSMRWFVR